MHDPSSNLKNTTELKFSRDASRFDRSSIVGYLIALFFALGLFLILHFREVKVEVYELNSMAPGYVVAQVDSNFLDEEATFILRQDALRDIGKIYQLSAKEVRQRKIEFENFLLYNQDWGGYAGKRAFEDVYGELDRAEKVLDQLRFTDPRTLQKLKDMGIDTKYYQIYTPADMNESVILPRQIWTFTVEAAFPENTKEQNEGDLVIGFFGEKKWKIEEDIPAQKSLRKIIQSKIADKYTHIAAGTRIIDQGEKVTARQYAIMQAIKNTLSDQRNLWSLSSIVGSLIMSGMLTMMCAFYFKINHPQVLSSNRKLLLIATITLLTLAFAKATEYLLINSSVQLFDLVRYPLFVPFAAILLCSLINPAVATFAAGFLTIILTMTLVFDPQGFMIMNLAAAVVCVLSTRSLRRRKEVFVVCGKAWLVCLAVSLSIHFYTNTLWTGEFISDAVSSAVFLLLTSILVVGLMPLLESSFKAMTDATLMEYMDPNNDLLRRLSIEAPGTYQHSVVMGNLAETAAVAIGANGLFCRVATLYHDIGKMATPQYFTENQQSGMNMHQLLTPLESAQVIMAHVSEGVLMARKAGLPEQFIDIIKEHHGTTLVYYFYRKQLEQVGGDKSQVDPEDFRYGGPKPRSKESGIIMIADCFEAASRSLDRITEETLMELVSRLIREKVEEGQLDDCLLTYEEMAIVKATLVKTMVAFSHSRVKYPKREPENSNPVES
ncbi:MAG: HD family phosphohydrolase [Parachlamydiaceae bacterium]